MSSERDLVAGLERLEARLDAVIALMLDAEAVRRGGSSRIQPERLLSDLGFMQKDIARIMGKTQSAVSQSLSRQVRKPSN
jgi:nitrate/nitrite-specific signal transduction histidine kinase